MKQFIEAIVQLGFVQTSNYPEHEYSIELELTKDDVELALEVNVWDVEVSIYIGGELAVHTPDDPISHELALNLIKRLT
jgi:hypothetical protein